MANGMFSFSNLPESVTSNTGIFIRRVRGSYLAIAQLKKAEDARGFSDPISRQAAISASALSTATMSPETMDVAIMCLRGLASEINSTGSDEAMEQLGLDILNANLLGYADSIPLPTQHSIEEDTWDVTTPSGRADLCNALIELAHAAGGFVADTFTPDSSRRKAPPTVNTFADGVPADGPIVDSDL